MGYHIRREFWSISVTDQGCAHLPTLFHAPSLNAWGHSDKSWEWERKPERDQSWNTVQVWCSRFLETWYKTERFIKGAIDFNLNKTGYTTGGLKWHWEAEHWKEKASTGKTQVHEEQTAQAITLRRKFKLAFWSFRFLIYPVAILWLIRNVYLVFVQDSWLLAPQMLEFLKC